MADLLTVTDSAYPFDYSILPDGVVAHCGYIGPADCTPHIWTAAEVADLERTGRRWWAIVVAPERALTSADGAEAAAFMLADLARRGYPKSRPVFYDIEHSAYVAYPDGAKSAAVAWQVRMTGAGWTHAYPYLPKAAGVGWLADWTGVRPTALPPGVAGVQYDHALAGDRYDISVFDPSLLLGATVPLTTADIDAIESRLTSSSGKLHDLMVAVDRGEAFQGATTAANGAARAVAALATQVDALAATVAQLESQVAQLVTANGPLSYTGTLTLHPGS